MKSNYAVLIHPDCAPKKINVPYGVEGLLETFRIVKKENEIFAHGKEIDVSVLQLNDKAHLLYVEDGNKLNLLPNRTIGRISLYGTMLIINLDKYGEMAEMTEIEAHHFCYVFDRTSIPTAALL